MFKAVDAMDIVKSNAIGNIVDLDDERSDNAKGKRNAHGKGRAITLASFDAQGSLKLPDIFPDNVHSYAAPGYLADGLGAEPGIKNQVGKLLFIEIVNLLSKAETAGFFPDSLEIKTLAIVAELNDDIVAFAAAGKGDVKPVVE